MNKRKKKGLETVDIDAQSAEVRKFIWSLPISKEGCLLIIDGKPLLKVIPNPEVIVDKAKLREAILRHRDESRRLNAEWEHVDREMWEKIEEMERKGGCPSIEPPGEEKFG